MANRHSIPISDFEARFGRWVLAVRWPIIVLTLLLVALATAGGAFLKSSSNYRMFFSPDNPQLLAFESLENTYEKSDNVLFMIVPDDGDATSERALEAALRLTERAWQTPLSVRVDSITNFQQTVADGDDLSVRDLVDPEKVGDAKERARIRATALTDPRLAGSLIAGDGAVSAVNVTVKLPETEDAARIAEVTRFARDLLAETEARFPSIDLRLAGTVVLSQAFAEATEVATRTILPAALVVMALILGVLVRTLAGVVATGLVIVFSVLATMGLGGWFGIPLTPTTAATPTIVLTMAVANCVHPLVSMLQRRQAGDSKHAAIVESIRLNLHPVFLASLTTTLGFLSMNFSEVPPYRHLGTLVATGVGISFVLSVTFMPALVSLLPVRARASGSGRDPIMGAVAEFVLRRRTVLLWGSVAVIALLASAVPRNELNDVLTEFLDESVELRRDTDFLDRRLSGNTVLEYSLASPEPGGVADPDFLADVSAFANWYRAQPEAPHVRVVSDTFRQLNRSMHGDDPGAYRLPASRDLAAQYLLLYELSLPFGLDLNNRIDVAKSATRMTVTAKTLSTQEVLALNARAEAWLKDNAPHIVRFESSGAALMFAHIGQRNIRAMLLGTVIAFIGISALLVVAFRSLRIGLVSLAPNFIPGLMGFGLWGLVVGEVGLALSVVMAMTIGIVVDDTVHFLSKYHRARRERGGTPEDAVRHAFQEVGRAMFTITVILVAGFLVLGHSEFFPTAQMGQLTAVVIALALIADFLFLPALLMAVDRSRGAREATRRMVRPAARHRTSAGRHDP